MAILPHADSAALGGVGLLWSVRPGRSISPADAATGARGPDGLSAVCGLGGCPALCSPPTARRNGIDGARLRAGWRELFGASQWRHDVGGRGRQCAASAPGWL